jgi:DNA polymerase-3 subunit alpha
MDMPADTKSAGIASKVGPWPQQEMLAYEKELLGYYVSGHPLDRFAGHFDSGKFSTIAQAVQAEESGTFKLAGILATVEKKFTKKDGKPFGVLLLEDFTGSLEITVWEEAFTKNAALLIPGSAIAVNARIARREDSVRATATSLAALKPKSSVKPVRLRLSREKMQEDDLFRILESVKRHPGPRPLFLEFVRSDGRSVEMAAGEEFAVSDERELSEELSAFVL